MSLPEERNPLSEYEEGLAMLVGELVDAEIIHERAKDEHETARVAEMEARWEVERITSEIKALKASVSNG